MAQMRLSLVKSTCKILKDHSQNRVHVNGQLVFSNIDILMYKLHKMETILMMIMDQEGEMACRANSLNAFCYIDIFLFSSSCSNSYIFH